MSEKMTKFKLQKSVKNNLRIISKSHAYLQSMFKTSVVSKESEYNCRRSCLHKVLTVHSLSLSKCQKKMTKFILQKKVSKINLRIISKSHAYFQSMFKTSVKFQKNRNKTVGGVAYTRYILLYGDGRTDGRTE